MYPYPKMSRFNGNREAAINLLSRITLDTHRFICIELSSHVLSDVTSAAQSGKPVNAAQMYDDLDDLKEWIGDSLSPTSSYEGWLQVNHGVLAEEAFPNKDDAKQVPERLKQSKLAWVGHMIRTVLEGKQ